ncbi:atx-3, partial [Pristionchus pacificus]
LGRMDLVEDPMTSIFFEKQEARLCAQHALNMLLQSQLFTAVDLAEIAGRLDREENEVLEAGHMESQNMDDSGFFSVQVITEALKTFKLELISIMHPGVADIKTNPCVASAFICNRSEHWFVIRKFGKQWFELNSCRQEPLFKSDLDVRYDISTLTTDGYSIFVVNGVLPSCDADRVLAENPVTSATMKRRRADREAKRAAENPTKASEKDSSKLVEPFSGSGARLGDSNAPPPAAAAAIDAGDVINISDDDDYMEAVRRSIADQAGPSNSTGGGGRGTANYDYDLRRAMELSTEDDSEERSFQMALAMSMEVDVGTSSSSMTSSVVPPPRKTSAEEMKEKRAAFLSRFEQK